MLHDLVVEYTLHPQHNHRVERRHADDPVEMEDFLMSLLVCGARILGIKQEEVPLDPVQSDRMLRTAAQRLAARFLATSLHLDGAEVRHRFGIAA